MRYLPTLAPLLIIAPVWGQTILIRSGDPSPSGVPGEAVGWLVPPVVNHRGGYACALSSVGPSGSSFLFWGNLSGGPGALLREASTVGNLEQTYLDGTLGVNATNVVYPASVTDTATGTAFPESLWIDDTAVLLEGDAVAGTSNFWTFMQRPGVTNGGDIYFRGGITDTPGGSLQGVGLFYGPSFTPIYITGETYPNMPLPLSRAALDARYRFSANGSHHITTLFLDQVSDPGRTAVALDGAGLVLGGTLVRTGEVVSPSIGGIGEAWIGFQEFGVNEAGDYVFTANTNAPISRNQVIVRNGVIWAREGDSLGGETLDGAIYSLSMNEHGNMAFLWSYDVGPGSSRSALYLDDEILLREGDEIDWDGDGVLDPGFTILPLTGSNRVALASDGSVYLTADVNVNGLARKGLFVVESSGIGGSYCAANLNSTGSAGFMTATGSAAIALNDVTLQAGALPTSSFGFFLASRNRGFTVNPGGSSGTLCLSGAIGVFMGPGQIQNSGPAGSISLPIDVTAMPLPTGTVAVQPGELWNFQLWHRDTGVGAPTSNFTAGYSILFQ